MLITHCTTLLNNMQLNFAVVKNSNKPQPFYGPFSGTTQVCRCQKRTYGLYGAREDYQRQTHRPYGWVPLHRD